MACVVNPDLVPDIRRDLMWYSVKGILRQRYSPMPTLSEQP